MVFATPLYGDIIIGFIYENEFLTWKLGGLNLICYTMMKKGINTSKVWQTTQMKILNRFVVVP